MGKHRKSSHKRDRAASAISGHKSRNPWKENPSSPSTAPRRISSISEDVTTNTGKNKSKKSRKRKSKLEDEESRLDPREEGIALSSANQIYDETEYDPRSNVPITQRPWLLQFPTRVRVRIWKYFGGKTLLLLRQVCHRIKFDIDNFVGLHATLDQTHRSYGFFTRVGIRSLDVTELVGEKGAPIPRILIYPDLLLRLSIQGPTSNAYFAYFIDNCPNIQRLEVVFTKRLLLLRPMFFPTKQWKIQLGGIRELEVTSETKNDAELSYVIHNLNGLLANNVKSSPVYNLQIHIVHNSATVLLRSCHLIVSEYVNTHSTKLVTLAVTIKEKRSERSSRNYSESDNVLGKHIRNPRGQDRAGEADLQDTPIKIRENPLVPVIWRRFENTKELHISMNGVHAASWKDLPLEMKILESLYLDIILPEGNWPLYRTTVHNCVSTLQKIYLVNVTMDQPDDLQTADDSIPIGIIDLGFLNLCKHLKVLTIKCGHQRGTEVKITETESLPKSLTSVHFSWANVTPCQVFKLLVFHRKLTRLQVDYCIASELAFKKFMCLLKTILKFRLTHATHITIVDHKVKFQSGLSSVNSIRKSLGDTKAKYVDDVVTKLDINTKPTE